MATVGAWPVKSHLGARLMHPAQQPTASLLGYLLPEDVSVGDSDKEKCIQGTPFDLEL